MVAAVSAGRPRGAAERLGRSISFLHASHLVFHPLGSLPMPCSPPQASLALCCLRMLPPAQSKWKLVPTRAGGVHFPHAAACRTGQFITISYLSVARCPGQNFPGCGLGTFATAALPGAGESHPNVSFIWENSSRADRTGDVTIQEFIDCFHMIARGEPGEGSWL